MKRDGAVRILAGIGVCFVFLFLSPPCRAQDGFTQKDREILTQLRVQMAGMEARLGETDNRFGQIEKRFEQIDRRFEQIDKRFEQVDKRFEQIDKRFEQLDLRLAELRRDVNARFDQLINFLYMLAAIFTTLVVAVIGFAYWDRRTIIGEAKRQTMEEMERKGLAYNILRVLQEYAEKDHDLKRILQTFKLL
ncbi:hypothetical protein SAMN02745206_03130 [Desulfacinum infernum DSM 9756]|uniref:Uncharacterized protein n=1 Tax=Desulfacinum infernum DSM 9756 TaxID=1121391 RepID=A0A1M5GGA0_9BACT|nr:hypothetical protein [Desulfacinum infernum]SHG02810.1 hypothetical protein SAMN02745206_03130 [Desulfacinum infernum DSM 9756]